MPKDYLCLVFREMLRVLQPGGLLLLTFHAGDETIHLPELWGRFIQCWKFTALLRLRALPSGRLSSASPMPLKSNTEPKGLHLRSEAGVLAESGL